MLAPLHLLQTTRDPRLLVAPSRCDVLHPLPLRQARTLPVQNFNLDPFRPLLALPS